MIKEATINNPDLVWGCAAIARVIRRTQRQTFYMLENGTLPAKKVGGRWVSERGKLLSHLLEDVA